MVKKIQAKAVIPIFFALVLAMYLLYSHLTVGAPVGTTSVCTELDEAEIKSLVGSFMKEKGFAVYAVENVGPVHCSYGVSTYNVNSDVTLPENPMNITKNVRLQIRSDVNETKIYEVVLSNPSRELFG